MNESNEKNTLKPSVGDHVHTLAKAGISAIPVLGGPAAEIFSAIIEPPLSKRRDKWIKEISEGLQNLQEKVEGFTIENLYKNEMFITTVMHASLVAVRNHQKDKIEALRNAVLNAALPNSPDEDMQLIFLNLIDTSTPWHLRILIFFNNPLEWGQKNGVAFSGSMAGFRTRILEMAYPELQYNREFYTQLFRDLFTRGLVNCDSLQVTLSGRSLFEPCTTNLAKKFINFITSPFMDKVQT